MINIKQHDTSRPFTDTLYLDDNPINLEGATVTLLLRNRQTLITTRRDAEVVSGIDGTVAYHPIPEDVAQPAMLDLEWEILFPDLTELTVPSSGYIELKVNRDLG